MKPLDRFDGVMVGTLRERCGVPDLRVVDVTRSTNDDLRRLAENGAPGWTTIVADFQEAGRGSGGRPWLARPGQSLLFSTLVRYHDSAAFLTAAPVRTGLRVARSIERIAGVPALVKWPNDVYIHDRKVAGILCEGAASTRAGYVVVGIGINVAQQDWPDDLPNPISLLQATGRMVSRADLLVAILGELMALPALCEPLDETELEQLRVRDCLRGHSIAVDDRPAGVADGITAEGELRVIGPDQRRTFLHSGSVRLSEP